MASKDDGNGTDTADPLEAALASGEISETSDVTEIAALLGGKSESPEFEDDDEGDLEPDESDTDDDDGSGRKPEESTPAAAKPAAKDEPKPSDDGKQPAAEATDTGDPADDKSFVSHPLYGVLKGTRAKLAEIRRVADERERDNENLRKENAGLKAKAEPGSAADTQALQDAADKAGLVDDEGNPIDVTTVNIESLRQNYEGPLVDAIEVLLKKTNAQDKVIIGLRKSESQRAKTAEEVERESIQRDIDSVPQLAEWQADTDQTMYDAAIAANESLINHPDWKSKPRAERYREVVRRLGGRTDAKPTPSADEADRVIAEAKRKAAAAAAPLSHSSLPSGSPAAQTTLESMDIGTLQIAERMASMSADKVEEMLGRLG